MSKFVNTALKAYLQDESKKLEQKVEENFKEWKDLEAQAAIKKSLYEAAKSEPESNRRMERDLRLGEDCHAWYLRSLLEDGSIRKVKPKLPSEHEVREYLTFAQDKLDFRVDFSGDIPRGRLEEFDGVPLPIYRALSNKGLKMDKKAFISCDMDLLKPYVEPKNPVRLRINLDMKNFSKDIIAGTISSDSPLERFKDYKPEITSKSLKAEIKERMVSFYKSEEVRI